MSNLLQQFVAARAARKPVTNDAQPVTRAEFNTLVEAVHGLIEDMEAATSPEKLTAAFNAALKEAAPTTNAARVKGKFLLPSDDEDDGAAVTNKRQPAGKVGYRLPEGD